jgi:hypothetical protein
MINFKVAGVSAAVSLILASAAVNAASTAQLVIPSNSSSVNTATGSYDAAVQQALASQATKSGMRSFYDNELGKATFVWAPSSIKTPDISEIAPAKKAEAAANFYLNALTGLSPAKLGVTTALLASMHDTGNGTKIAKYKQEILGIEVFNREYNVMMNAEFSLVAGSGYFARNLLPAGQIAPDFNFGIAERAIQFAVNDAVGGDMPINLTAARESGKYTVFNAQSLVNDKNVGAQPRAKKVYFDGNGGLVPSYYVEVEVSEVDSVNSEIYGYVVNAITGKVLVKNNLVSDDSIFHYRAYAKYNLEPMQGPHGDVIPALALGNDATEILDAPLVSVETMPFFSQQDPWLPPDATTTSGNNAFAYADVIAPQGFSAGDFTAEVTSDRTFDYVLDDSQRANSFDNRKAAIVNLFYMTNFLHNYYYDYGFDEASGNAQLSNFGRGGFEGDPLLLEAQDNSGLNNANMSTPADGASPRMQQFLWNDKDAVVGEDWGTVVTNPDGIGLLGSSQVSPFGPLQYSDLTGAAVRVYDGDDAGGAGSVTDGCQAAVNIDELVGKIALIDRGACPFTTKVLTAQNAGAIGAIIVNNIDDGTPSPMGGADNSVTIPSQGLNFADGAQLYDLVDVADAAPVEVEMFSTFPLKDSTFDNAIIAHEFGHYIQNRLIGNASGLRNFQGRAMGEGWADVHAMIFVTKEEDLLLAGNEEFGIGYAVGSYVTDFFRGIRRAPYTTNMDVNPFSFEHITTGAGPDGFPATTNESPHGAGEIWAVSLWEFYVSLINEHGFTEAKDRISRYVVEGYKLTPVLPLYTEARDAVLAAAFANDSGDFNLAIAAFAKRGMGFGAVSPARESTDLSGVVPSNKTQLATYSAVDIDLNTDFDGETLGFCTTDGVLDKGETGTISVTIANTGSEILEGVTAQIEVIGDADITLENDGLITFDTLAPFSRATSSALQVTVTEADIAENVTFVVRFPESVEGDDVVEASPVGLDATLNFSFERVAPVGKRTSDDMEDGSSAVDWTTNVMAGGELAQGLLGFDSVNTSFFQSSNPQTNLGSRTLFLSDLGAISDVGYESDEMEVGFQSNFSVSFWHAYLFETGFDGGVVEISVNGSDWADVTDFGGTFAVSGYNLLLDPSVADQPLAGRNVFSGRNFAPAGGGVETVNFGDVLNGSLVKFRFRIATDSSARDFGWFIDNVTFTNIETPIFSEVITGETVSCDNSLPQVTATETVTVNEGGAVSLSASAQDRDMPETGLSYSWTQTSGTTILLTGAETANVSFTAPQVGSATNFTFQVAVSDGTDVVTASSVVTVNNVPQPEVPVVSRRNGGSTSWLALFLLPIALLRRRNKR